LRPQSSAGLVLSSCCGGSDGESRETTEDTTTATTKAAAVVSSLILKRAPLETRRVTTCSRTALDAKEVSESRMDYTKLTIAELANGVNKTETAIRRCREILDDLQEPKTAGMQAVVKAIRDLLPQLEQDLKALAKAYTKVTERKR
jgi:hypothetical protein